MARKKHASSWPVPAAALALSLIITLAILLLNPAERMKESVGDWGYFGVFIIMLLSNATVIFPAPGLLSVFAAGGAYDILLVGIAGGLGAGFGELTGYLFGYGGRGLVHGKRGKWHARVESWMRRNGFATIAILAAIPNPFFDIAGITAGALRYDWRKFLLACVLGATVKSLIFAYLGYSLMH